MDLFLNAVIVQVGLSVYHSTIESPHATVRNCG